MRPAKLPINEQRKYSEHQRRHAAEAVSASTVICTAAAVHAAAAIAAIATPAAIAATCSTTRTPILLLQLHAAAASPPGLTG